MKALSRFTAVRALVFCLALVLLVGAALPAFAQGGVTVVANNNLTLRASASRTSASLGTIPFGTQLTATAISPDGNWVAVEFNGQGGWLSLAYTGVVSGNLSALPVSSQTFSEGGGGAATSSIMVAATINLRYRMSPSLDERPAGAIPVGTQVPALALSEDGLFVLVSYNGQNVWVYREYVSEVAGSLSSFVPGAAPVAGQPAAPAQASQFIENWPSTGIIIDMGRCRAWLLSPERTMDINYLPANQPVTFWDFFGAADFGPVVTFRETVTQTLLVDGQVLSPRLIYHSGDYVSSQGILYSGEDYFWTLPGVPSVGTHEVQLITRVPSPIDTGLDVDQNGANEVYEGNYLNACNFTIVP